MKEQQKAKEKRGVEKANTTFESNASSKAGPSV